MGIFQTLKYCPEKVKAGNAREGATREDNRSFYEVRTLRVSLRTLMRTMVDPLCVSLAASDVAEKGRSADYGGEEVSRAKTSGNWEGFREPEP